MPNWPGRSSPIRIVPPSVESPEPPWAPAIPSPSRETVHSGGASSAVAEPLATHRANGCIWTTVTPSARRMAAPSLPPSLGTIHDDGIGTLSGSVAGSPSPEPQLGEQRLVELQPALL